LNERKGFSASNPGDRRSQIAGMPDNVLAQIHPCFLA